ncbi:MAG TPA: macro domain-containing protein [Steroidobacteraceae bacterium]|nr:macro domain-containing protein [Steroidobacteraceae bacterium]
MQRSLRGVTIECIRGSITDQPDMDAIVNAANSELRTGGGVAGAIHSAAGPGLASECRAFAPIRPGQAVITGAHALPNRYVIHCLGPVYGRDEPADQLLAACYRNALRLAAQDNIASIAFPAISTGAFGYPLEPAAEIAVHAVMESVLQTRVNVVTRIRFVLFDAQAERIYAGVIERLLPPCAAQ